MKKVIIETNREFEFKCSECSINLKAWINLRPSIASGVITVEPHKCKELK